MKTTEQLTIWLYLFYILMIRYSRIVTKVDEVENRPQKNKLWLIGFHEEAGFEPMALCPGYVH